MAAAEETGDLSVVPRAAGMLGAPSEALDHAERAGLLLLNGNTVNFRHPLARSAIYQHATFAARRAAPEALARELHREQEVDRRAWHLSASRSCRRNHWLPGGTTTVRRRAGSRVAEPGHLDGQDPERGRGPFAADHSLIALWPGSAAS